MDCLACLIFRFFKNLKIKNLKIKKKNLKIKKSENQKSENIMKMDDLLIFMTLEKLKKTHRNVAVWTDAYAVQKN